MLEDEEKKLEESNQEELDETLNNTQRVIDDNQAFIDRVKVPETEKNFLEKDIDKASDQFSAWHADRKFNFNPANWAYMSGWSMLDLPLDIIGATPGLGKVDDTWDQVTKFNNEGAKKYRELAGPIIASIYTTGKYQGLLNASSLTGTTKAVANVGGSALINGVIAGVSDYGENPENRLILSPQNFERLSKAAPWFAGPNGIFPSLGDLANAEATHPTINRVIAGLDEGVLQGIGDLIGYAINAGKPYLRNIIPKSQKSAAWKFQEQTKHLEIDTKAKIQDIEAVIQSGTLTKAQVEALTVEKHKLIYEAINKGSSEATNNAGESFIKARQTARNEIRNTRAVEKLTKEAELDNEIINTTINNMPEDVVSPLKGMSEEDMMKLPKEVLLREVKSLGLNASDEQLAKIGLTRDFFKPKPFDPDITPGLASEKNLAGISTPIPGAAVQNVVDVDAHITGAIDPHLSLPNKALTDSMQDHMILGPNSRKIVANIANQVEEADEYNAVLGQFKTNSKLAGTRVYEIYNRIMKAGTGDELKALLKSPDYRDTKGLINELQERVTQDYLDETASEAAAVAIFDLINLYIGREITESSARLMHTLGQEISVKAGVPVEFKNLIDDAQVFKNVQDKLEVLELEYGISKYVAGWQLNNKKWWKKWIDEVEDPGEIAITTLQEFTEKQKQLKTDYKLFREQLDLATQKNPKLARTLMKAYEASDGNVDTLHKLSQWNKYHLSPLGLIYNPGSKELGISNVQMNEFASGAWAVTYNNVLSGISTLRAAVGNGVNLVLKPISAFTRAGLSSVLRKDMEPLERVSYLYGGMFETAGRALEHAVIRLKKVHNDPNYMLKVTRKDFVTQKANRWEILDDYKEEWLKEGDYLNNFMYGWANWQRKIANQPWFRTGITGMSSVDAYTDTFMATFQSRLEAYSEVYSKYGKTLDPEDFANKLKGAEEINYNNMFDNQGLLKEGPAKRTSGEIALNLDDGFSNAVNPWLNQFPPLKTLLMFPRTSMNQLKLNLSYTPIAAIPHIGKYGDILDAGNDINKIHKVLETHGVKNVAENPHAMEIYKNIRDEYEGRIMMGAGTVSLAYMYALAGNVRGNGPVDHIELVKMKRKGWKPNHVKIGNTWVSYKGIPMVEQFLNLMGDMAYYQTALGSNLTEEYHRKAIWTIAATYLNQTPLQGIEPIVAMIRGDAGAFQRIAVQNIRAASLLSGAHGVVAKAIDNAQKEIYKDFWAYLRNNSLIRYSNYSKIDHWTGEEVDAIDNPILRILNAISPISVHGANEPWRLWLLNSGFDDLNEIKYSSRGVEYTPEERELIGRFIGEQQLWKRINSKEFMHNKKFNKQLDQLRSMINSGAPEQEVLKERDKLAVYQRLKKMINLAKEKAELKIAQDPKYRHIDILGIGNARVTKNMEYQKIDEALDQARKNQEVLKDAKRGGTKRFLMKRILQINK